ncbi:conserved exported hypothetical protein [uncultured Defluviicoccus sp.]|uniref:Right handed beta helix domain-containing protein n=1 Tax=metagenome TaxID=256318 RepID=A0A380TEY1_9ZZZZ|nr:conserved exported hypothetical protein [uncultured Defluviicoccus sp.]
MVPSPLLFVAGVLSLATALQAADFFVAPTGDDRASGTLAAPFRTLRHAVKVMSPGDHCILRGGTYREEIVIEKPNLTFSAQEGEYVLLSGCDQVADWKEGRIEVSGLTCQQAAVPARVYAVFGDGRPLPLARWPNKTADMLSYKDWAETNVDGKKAQASLTALPAKAADFWRDGFYVGVHAETPPLKTWFTIAGRITSSRGDTLSLDQTTYGFGGENGSGAGFGYIIDSLGALDADGEWCWRNGSLYLKLAESGPRPVIEAQTRLFIMWIQADGTTLQGLNFKAGALDVTGDKAKILGCTFRYSSAFHHVGDPSGASNWGVPAIATAGVHVQGAHAEIRDCYFAHSWWSGLTLSGSHLLVENCLVEDCNWIGRRGGGIQCHGDDNVIRRCTVRRTGGSSIEGGNANWLKKYARRNLWELNRCEEPGCLVVDQAFFYINLQRGDNPPSDSEWRYNLLLNNRGPDRGNWRESAKIGIYVDNSSSGFKVHHNIVVGCGSGIRYNDHKDGEQAGRDVYFCNNTFYKTEQAFALGVWKREGPNGDKLPARMDAGITFRNNLALDCGKFGYMNGNAPIGDNNYGFIAADTAVIAAENLDFRLKPGTRFVDCAPVIPGITDGYHGAWPDMGALESGLDPWVAGASLVRPVFPD